MIGSHQEKLLGKSIGNSHEQLARLCDFCNHNCNCFSLDSRRCCRLVLREKVMDHYEMPINDIEAFTLALRLALNAATDELAQESIAIAGALSTRMTTEQVDEIKAMLEAEAVEIKAMLEAELS